MIPAHPKPQCHARTRPLLGLQYLRALAALAVVTFHSAARAGYDFRVGEAGVDLFFLLSGFLMVAITGDDTRPATFLADRFRRIVPTYWIATSIILLGALLDLFPKMQLAVEHVASSYLFIPAYSPSNGRIWPLLVPGWTLNYEIMFYLLFAAAMALGPQIRRMVALTSAFAGLVLLGVLLHPNDAIGAFYTDPILLEFVAGGWIGMLWKRPGEWPRWIGWPMIMIAAMLMIAVGIAQTDAMRVLLFGVPAALLLLGTLGLERRAPVEKHRGLLLLGNASFSIYLFHTMAVSVAAHLCGRLDLPGAVLLPMGIFGGVVAGLIGFLLIEEPILRFFRQRRAPVSRVARSPFPVSGEI